jgi:hypothetical protein
VPLLIVLAVLAVLWPWPLLAQTPSQTEPAPTPSPGSTPVPSSGSQPGSTGETARRIIRATRLSTPLRLDGALDEAFYAATPPASGFTQNDPQFGAPASEETEVWVSFDDDNLYVSMRAHESQPDRMIVSEMRRDSQTVLQNENFAFALDTFDDRRNSFVFQFNPIGGRMDGQNTSEGTYNGDWNPVWRLAVGRFDGGWTGEAAIPFKSIRYRTGLNQQWGFTVRRINRWRNEVSFLTPMFRGIGNRGIFMASQYAALVGIDPPQGSRTLELKPYAISNVTSDNIAVPRTSNDLAAEVGLDAKYGVTQNVTADFTLNTDFAQVEADEQQVNLTRFSLFFPEKRDFFLENQGFFLFAGGANVGANATSTTAASASTTSNTPVLFYSRRIGLENGREIPIIAGARASGRVGKYTLGVLNIQTDEEPRAGLPTNNFTVARVRRDVLRRGAVGGIWTGRQRAAAGGGQAQSYGLDANFAFFANLGLSAYWAKTETPGVTSGDTSYRANLDYNGDRYGVNIEQLTVGQRFNPEIGFVRRTDMERSHLYARFSPRPGRAVPAVRKFSWAGTLNYVENTRGTLETREQRGDFRVEFQNSDTVQLSFQREYQFFEQPFSIAGVQIPSGRGYDFDTWSTEWTLGRQHWFSGTMTLERGSFYDGTRTAAGISGSRVNVSRQLSVEPGVSVNRARLPYGDFTTTLVTSRITYTLTPMLFVSGLVQYNSTARNVSTNLRLRWEYRPGSEFFVVLNESRDTARPGYPELQNRALIVKFNRLFRF